MSNTTKGSRPNQKKQKVCEIAILPKHLPYLRQTQDNGVLYITNALWLAAFAAYNVENEVRLSPEFHGSYPKVYQFILNKIG